MLPSSITVLAQQVINDFARANLMIATAESCTGGLISAACTEIAGSSSVVDRGFTTYSNEAKAEMLNVPIALITEQGAVSEPVARAMVQGALTHSNADIAIAVTGIAGPGGGSIEKPVGLVYLAVGQRNKKTLICRELFGDIGRSKIREATVIKGLQMLLDQLVP